MSEGEKKKDTDPVEVLMNLKERKPESDKTEQDSGAVKEDEAKPETLADVIREHAIEGEEPLSRSFTLGKILGGDILNTAPIRRQIGVFLLITLFAVIYISNRYSCQQYLIQIDNLDKELKDAMSSPSQLSMLPLVGFTVTLSAFTLSATSSQKSRLAVMMNIALPTTDTATNMSTMAMKL